MNCLHCQKYNRPGLLLCEHCGQPLVNISEFSRNRTRELSSTGQPYNIGLPISYQRAGTGLLHQSSFVTLDLVQTNTKLHFKTEGHILLGRRDKEANWQPTVDLTPYGAVEKGVSRAHIDLFFESDQVFVLEMGSANGTRVNGMELRTGTAMRVYNGDGLELGKLALKVYFGPAR